MPRSRHSTPRRLLAVATGLVVAMQPVSRAAIAAAMFQPPTPTIPEESKLNAEDLEAILAPIALYPDTLLANVLAAAIFPDQIIAAHVFLAQGGDPDEILNRDWDPPVQAVASLPDVLQMLFQNPDWTAAIGVAYLVQPDDVLNAVQRLRQIAWDNGALQSTPQHTIIQQESIIVIEPARPNIIYVPRYDPQVIFVRDRRHNDVAAAALIGFGVGIVVGSVWVNNSCNWRGGRVWWGGGWGHTHVRNNNNVNININNNNRNNNNNINIGGDGRPWRPSPDRIGNRDRAATLDRVRGAGRESGRPNVGQGSGGSNVRDRVPGRTPESPITRPSTRPTPGNRPGGISVPNNTGRPGINRPPARPVQPSTRPSLPPASGPVRGPNVPNNIQRPSTRPAVPPATQRPSAGAGTGNRPGGGVSRPSTLPATLPATGAGPGNISRPANPSRPSGLNRPAPSRPVARPAGAGGSRPAGGARPSGSGRPAGAGGGGGGGGRGR